MRQLRRANNHTQAEMALRLGISAAYVNLLENNQRSLSVKVLMALGDGYGVDWRKLVNDNELTRVADLRAAVRDPIFADEAPDLQELRAAIDHAPRVVERFLHLYQNHRLALDNVRRLSMSSTMPDLLAISPETAIHDFFRDNSNHFPQLELAAEATRSAIGGPPDELYSNLKRHLHSALGIETRVVPLADLPDALRVFDQDWGRVLLSEGLDPVNRTFQLAHVLALVSCGPVLDGLIETAGLSSESGLARCRVELANYYAAAVLMPYDRFFRVAEDTQYDIDRIAASFGVSFEQVCQRLTTLHRPGAKGVPFFFLRLDRAGNVTKRFNATGFTLAEQGGACPVWNIHTAFAAPDVIVPQIVELPDAGQYFTLSRTTNRPVLSRHSQDRRLVVTLGCERQYIQRLGYGASLANESGESVARIGINCHVCPRQACAQRAHEPLHVNLPIDANRRGSTRYES